MKLIFRSFLVVAAVIVLAGGWYWWHRDPMVSSAERLIRSESIKLLATDRLVTQIVIELDEGDTIFGTDHAVAYGKVTLILGIDLQKIVLDPPDPSGRSIIRLPDPEVLAVDLDEASVRYMRKASLIQRLIDVGDDKQSAIRERLKERARAFVEEEGLMPSRELLQTRFVGILHDMGISSDNLVFMASDAV
jgi:hypothetical protein